MNPERIQKQPETSDGIAAIESFMDTLTTAGEQRDIEAELYDGEDTYPCNLQLVHEDGEVVAYVKQPWGGDPVAARKGNLKETIAQLFEVTPEQVDVRVTTPLQEGGEELQRARQENEQLRAENQSLQNEIEQMRAQNEMLERRVQELDAMLAAVEIDAADTVDDAGERALDYGMTIDEMGVMRQRFFAPAYLKLVRDLERQEFAQNAQNTLHLLTRAFRWDEEVDHGWAGKGTPEDVTSAQWKKRVPPGFTVEQIVRRPLKGIAPGSSIDDYRTDQMVVTLNLTMDINARAKEVQGMGPATAEARALVGQFLNMNRSQPSEFIDALTAPRHEGGLDAKRINFSLMMQVDGEKKEIAHISIPTETKRQLRQRYLEKK